MPENKTVLLTLGRLPVALTLARAFNDDGWRVVVADPWPDHLCRRSKAVDRTETVTAPRRDSRAFRRELEAIARREQADLIVPVSEETLHVARLKELGLPVFCQPFEQLLTLHDKYRFAKLAESLDLRVPATADHLSARLQRDETISKPRLTSAGRGMTFRDTNDNSPLPDGHLLQQRIRGREVCAFGIAVDGRVMASTVYQPTVVSETVAVTFDTVDRPDVVDWLSAFVAATKHTGFIGLDFIIDHDDVAWALECNPRATSGIHCLAPEDILPAITGQRVSEPQRALSLTESWSAFTEALSAPSFREFLRRLGLNRAAKDITWLAEDPWPTLAMPYNSSRLLMQAISKRQSFAQAAVEDIEWKPSDA